jgi:hypothetical protein
VVAAANRARAYFTPQCPSCALDALELCDPEDPVVCTNECLPNEQVDNCDVSFPTCCEKVEEIAVPCTTTADCEVNECVDSAAPLGSTVLPEGRWVVSELQVRNLTLFDPGGTPETISCGTDVNIEQQFDPPLNIVVGPSRSNDVRLVMDLTALIGLLPNQNACDIASANYPAWFDIVDE